MPSGIHLSKIHLGQIWQHRVMLERSPAQIFLNVFHNNPNMVSFGYLCRLCRACDTGLEVARFQGERAKRSGGPKFIVDAIAEGFLLDIFRQEKQVRLDLARAKFIEEYYGLEVGGPSVRTVGRVLKRCNYTRKVMQRVHYLRDPVKRAEYMDNCGPFHFSRLVDIDETLSTWKGFLQRYGYAPKGHEAIKTQFRINGRHYSSICAYSPIGLRAYRVVEG